MKQIRKRLNKSIFYLPILIAILASCALPPDENEEEQEGSAEDDDLYTSTFAWAGETEKFSISSKGGVHLDASQESSGTAYVTFPSTAVRDTRWEFGVHLTFNPSSNNYARFYLTSSSTTLSDSTDGYFVQIGGVKDNVALYRQDGNQPKLLISGRELMKGNSSPKLYVQTECDSHGYWTLRTRLESESEYTLEKQVKDTACQSSVCAGICCIYTKTRADGFIFHHILLSKGVENVEDTSDKPAIDEPKDDNYTQLPEDVKGMLLFNEVMYDNAPDGAEYVEIYNPSEQDITLPAIYLYKMKEDGKVFDLTTLQMQDPSTPLTIHAQDYLCFTKDADKLIQKHQIDSTNIIEVAKLKQLSNDDGYLALLSSEDVVNGHTFDTCCFRENMHDSKSKSKKGISLAKKSPELSSLTKNWHSSTNATGGTPGIKND